MVEMVELVIKIPEEVYEKIQKRKVNQYDIDDICQSVFEGTLLPKGHGRIVDISQMTYMKTLNEAVHNRLPWAEAIIKIKNSAPTIVEADKESEE